MKYRRLGSSGLKVSEICLGAWIGHREPVDESATYATLNAAMEEGINFFDLADMYAAGEAEKCFGRWMKNIDRRQLVITSKCRARMWDGPNGEGLSRKHIIAACEDSLRRLGTDYIDLYLLHYPDPDTPLEESMRALDDLVRAGKVHYTGCSNFTAPLITASARIAERRNFDKFVALEQGYNMLQREMETDILPACVTEGLGVIAFSPLAQGLLTNKYLTGELPPGSRGASGKTGSDFLKLLLSQKLPVLQALAKIATARDLPLSHLALAWLLHQPAMAAPVIGASRPSQVRENVRASGVELTPAELHKIEEILKGNLC